MLDSSSSPQRDRVTVDFSEAIAEVTLNRPDKLNALDPAMFEAIIAAGERLSRMAGLRAVVLTGAGRGFSAGLDKETLASFAMGDGGADRRRSGDAHAWARE
jgi:enoyl-CoA hydratase/carnithine racemase